MRRDTPEPDAVRAVAAAEAGDYSDSSAHAVIFGLRNPRDETQLTSVVGAIARTDADFSRAFASALLAQAADDCPHLNGAHAALGSLPDALSCAAERILYDEHGSNLGRVDLIFETADPHPFVLVVENKLYSGYGKAQLTRYQAGLRVVRGHGGRGGLLALTRDVPTSGELRADDEGWLGSIRWARLLPRLRTLPIADAGVAKQWQLLLDVLDEQGDLGMTRIDADAVRAWSRYFDGRQQLEWLLEQIFTEVLEHTRDVLTKSYRVALKREETAALWYKPRARKVLIQQSQVEVQFSISVPATYTERSLRVGVWMEDPGEVGFGVTVAPRDAGRFFERRDPDLMRQLRSLASAGFEQAGTSAEWYSRHPGPEVLEASDAPAALLAAVKDDISAVASSKILGYDLRKPVPAKVRRKKSEPWG